MFGKAKFYISTAISAAYVLAWVAVAAQQVGTDPPPVPASAPVQMALAMTVAVGLGFVAGWTWPKMRA